MSDNEKVRKTIVTRTVSRKINTAQFETLDIGITVQQEIEWSTNKELWDKSRSFDKYVEADFQQAFQSLLQGLNLSSMQGSTPDIKMKKGSEIGEEFDTL